MSLYSSKISICLAFLKTAFEKKLDKRCSCEYIKCRSIDGHLPFTKYFGYTRILYYTYIIHNIHHSSDGNGKSFGYMPRRWKLSSHAILVCFRHPIYMWFEAKSIRISVLLGRDLLQPPKSSHSQSNKLAEFVRFVFFPDTFLSICFPAGTSSKLFVILMSYFITKH